MSWIMLEYLCPDRHRFDSLEVRGSESAELDCPRCGLAASRTISAPRISTIKLASAVRTGGLDDERPPNVPDTSRLADGESYNSWRESYAKESRVRDADLERAAGRVRSLSEDKVT